jgi:hypothetical protein
VVALVNGVSLYVVFVVVVVGVVVVVVVVGGQQRLVMQQVSNVQGMFKGATCVQCCIVYYTVNILKLATYFYLEEALPDVDKLE